MPGLNHSQQDIDDFVNITQASHEDAEHFLHQGTTLQGAIEDFYATQAAAGAPHQDLSSEPIEQVVSTSTMSDQPGQSTGPRTLDGRPVDDIPQGWARPQKKQASQRSAGGIATLWNTGSARRDGDDDDDDDEEQNYYAGGEQSGLAVQDPNQGSRAAPSSIVDNILQQAARNGPVAAPERPSTAFRGSGHTLGSDEVPSETVGLGGSQSSQRPFVPGGSAGSAGIGRTVPQDGESDEGDEEVQDGPLFSYDTPEDKALLQAIQAGRAPPSVFGVRYDQPTSVLVGKRLTEDYQPPPKKPAKPFGGSGNRLGNVAPEVGSGSTSPTIPGGFGGSSPTPIAAPTAPASTAGSKFEVDESKPTTSIQVRLGDGTRIVAKVNLSHTVGDLRAFVVAARPDTRPFVLQTTFPSKELKDDSATVEEAGLKNAVVVQRFI